MAIASGYEGVLITTSVILTSRMASLTFGGAPIKSELISYFSFSRFPSRLVSISCPFRSLFRFCSVPVLFYSVSFKHRISFSFLPRFASISWHRFWLISFHFSLFRERRSKKFISSGFSCYLFRLTIYMQLDHLMMKLHTCADAIGTIQGPPEWASM